MNEFHAHLQGNFVRSFEDVVYHLSRLPRLFCEPDGSFVWRGSDADGDWQLDGQLFDRDERLLYVELKGTATPRALDAMLTSLGWPEIAIEFQLAREGVVLNETEFRGRLWPTQR